MPGGHVAACCALTPHESRQSVPPYLHRQTGIRNEVTLDVLSNLGRPLGVGANRKTYEVGLSQTPTPFRNGQEMLTDSRWMGW
jgi:hypothetical protein